MEADRIATTNVLAKLHQRGEHETARRLVEALDNGDPVLWSDEWLSIKKRDGWYTYMHDVRTKGQIVAVLGYRRKGDQVEFVGRYETCPPHDDGMALCALTGGVEPGDTVLQTAQKELWEEAGIEASPQELRYLGMVRPSKASDTAMHCFAVDVRDRDIGKSTGDGTKGEEGAYCRWISFEDAVKSKDPTLAMMAARVYLDGK